MMVDRVLGLTLVARYGRATRSFLPSVRQALTGAEDLANSAEDASTVIQKRSRVLLSVAERLERIEGLDEKGRKTRVA